MKKKKINYYWWILPIIFILIIFWFSSKPADVSDSQSFFLVYYLDDFLRLFNIECDLHFLNHIVRKCAHFSEYTLLGILVTHANHKAPIHAKFPLVFLLIPILDELTQYFTPGRSCQISDMLLDSSGIIFGIILYILFRKYILKHKRI